MIIAKKVERRIMPSIVKEVGSERISLNVSYENMDGYLVIGNDNKMYLR